MVRYISIVPTANQGVTSDMTIGDATRATMPDDIGSADGRNLLPVNVAADGNFLPHTASIPNNKLFNIIWTSFCTLFQIF